MPWYDGVEFKFCFDICLAVWAGRKMGEKLDLQCSIIKVHIERWVVAATRRFIFSRLYREKKEEAWRFRHAIALIYCYFVILSRQFLRFFVDDGLFSQNSKVFLRAYFDNLKEKIWLHCGNITRLRTVFTEKAF